MLRAFTLVLGLGTLLVGGLACGGSNSTTTTQSTALSNTGSLPVVRMLSPQAGASVSPGQVLMLSLATENFELRPPVDVPPGDPTGFRGTLRALPTAELGAGFVKHHPDHSDAVEEDTHKDHGVRADDDVMPDHDNDHVHDHAVHDHNPSVPLAEREMVPDGGHLHVYLDGGEGDAAHVTAWVDVFPVELPADISLGEHSLRIELRNDNHQLISNELDLSLPLIVE